MNRIVLAEGRPVHVASDGDEPIGRGPWARLLATAVVGDESSPRAERGRILARSGHVHTVAIAPGTISARVIGGGSAEYDVTLATTTIPARTWAAVAGAPRVKPLLAAALTGSAQSVHLQHEMLVDWEQPLVPFGRAIRRTCTCPDASFAGTCKHVVALAYVVADAIDGDPSLLLAWRGYVPTVSAGSVAAEDEARPVTVSSDRWRAGLLPELGPARALPPAAVLKRLGPSGIRAGERELEEALLPAYTVFAAVV